MLNRRHLLHGFAALPLAMSTMTRAQAPSHIEPPTPLWELLSLLPPRAGDGEPFQLTGLRAEMIFPGLLRSTRDIPAAQVRPIIDADTHHMIAVKPAPPDESLMRLCGVGMDRIDAIGTFWPCTIFIGKFSGQDVHAAWGDLGYQPTDDPDIWSWKGLPEDEMSGEVDDALLVMQQRLSLPPRSRGHFRFLTCIGDRYVVEARSETTLRQMRDRYRELIATGTIEDWPFGGSGIIPASTGHVAALYEGDRFITERRPDSSVDRENQLRAANEDALASIEQELGRMPRVRTALLGVTPGTPWREPLDTADLPTIASSSLVHVHLESEEDAGRYLAIATARFDALVSWSTEEAYSELFSFSGNVTGSHVSINLGHARAPRYDVLQMAYFSDLAFLTREPDGSDTWRSGR